MEPLGHFARGTLLGFSIAAPVGPIGVLCIRRTLAEGRATGLATGLGAAVAGLGLGAAGAGRGAAAILVAGVVVGSAAWWLLLSAGVDRLRHRFDANSMRWVNRISGTVIVAFAAWSLAGAFGGKS